VAGLGALVQAYGGVLTAISLLGAAYLAWFAVRSFRRARRPEALSPAERAPGTARGVAATVLALTFLNPHVYLDTVLLLGTIGASFDDQRWWFALGASAASAVWFAGLGYGA
jgi:L-lysine exporter family protein LysE/ArgO